MAEIFEKGNLLKRFAPSAGFSYIHGETVKMCISVCDFGDLMS